MRTSNAMIRALLAASLATTPALAACGGDGTTCGPGTIAADGVCVLDEGPAASAPTLTAATSATPFAGGGVLVLEGTGFAGAGAGVLRVFVDDAEQPIVLVESATRAVTSLPVATGLEVEVRVETELGTASAEFRYLGMLGARGGATGAIANDLLLVDPRDGFSTPIARLASDGDRHAVSGLAFHPDGTLYGAEVNSTSASAFRLLEIDPDSGEVTVIGPLNLDVKGGGNMRVSDLAFDGETLYGVGRSAGLYPIDLTTGTLSASVTDQVSGSLAIRDGVAISMLESGTYVEFDLSAGEVVATTTLPDAGERAPASLTFYDGELRAGATFFGTLREIDPDAGVHEPIGYGVPLDALVALPTDDAARAARRTSPGGADLEAYAARYAELAPTRAPAAPPTARPLRADAYLAAVAGAVADDGTMLAALAPGGADVVSADGPLRLSAAEVAAGVRLQRNRRGTLKLLGPGGATLARDLIAITPR